MSAREHAIEQYIARRFSAGTTARSREYQSGFRLGLLRGLGQRNTVGDCPYAIGTAAADAWFAGVQEGRWRSADETTEHLRRSRS